MLKNLLRLGAVLTLAAFVASCSKSSNSTGSGNNAPTLAAPAFAGPDSSASADTSTAAQVAIGAALTFNATAGGYLHLISGLQGSQSGGTWTWSYTYQQTGGKITWTATSSSNGYNWKLVENGTIGNNTYSNWTALSGYESSDGKTGNWVLYYPNSTQAVDSASWSTNASGTLTGTIIVYGTTGSITETLVFTNNSTSHIGSLIVYQGPASQSYEVWNISWTATGGTWTEYYGGVAINTGHW